MWQEKQGRRETREYLTMNWLILRSSQQTAKMKMQKCVKSFFDLFFNYLYLLFKTVMHDCMDGCID